MLAALLCWTGSPVLAADGPPERSTRATPFELPTWFKASFLDLKDDVTAATGADKRLLVYIGQEGCPYCRELIQNNFSQRAIVDYTRHHFDVVAINMWGDAEVTDMDGRRLSEKEFARQLNVRYTPTLLFFDEQGQVALRVNGYYPPHQFNAALRYVAERREKTQSFRDYYATAAPAAASGALHVESYMLRPPYHLGRNAKGKPLLVLFEQKQCADCDALHRNILSLPDTQALLRPFDVVLLDMWATTPVITPQGTALTAATWARQLGLVYAPSAVFFDNTGQEVMRSEGLLKTFHVQSVLDYVGSGAYRRQPELQRFIEERGAALREKGVDIELWK
jgi:thioredoxin-related protein